MTFQNDFKKLKIIFFKDDDALLIHVADPGKDGSRMVQDLDYKLSGTGPSSSALEV